MSQTSTIIALVGLCGTGKSEACAYLQSQGYTLIYFGGTVVEEVKRRGLMINPDNERIVREALRAEYGMAAMAHLNLPYIEALLNQGCRVAIDGVYSMGELEVLYSLLGDRLKVLAIHAPKLLRYERLGQRPVRPLTPIQIDDRDKFEIKHLDKAAPIVLADAHIVNDSNKAGLLLLLSKAIEPWL